MEENSTPSRGAAVCDAVTESHPQENETICSEVKDALKSGGLTGSRPKDSHKEPAETTKASCRTHQGPARSS